MPNFAGLVLVCLGFGLCAATVIPARYRTPVQRAAIFSGSLVAWGILGLVVRQFCGHLIDEIAK
jgi:hypothetical protein